MTLNLAETSVAKSRPSVPYGANLLSLEAAGIRCLHKHKAIGCD